ncbi:MAG TPA: N-acetylglucosamine-6-phosphate deacetylase [Stenomitos sp.]
MGSAALFCMSVRYILHNAKIPGYKGLQQIALDEHEVIVSIEPVHTHLSEIGCSRLDIAGDWISLGGLDLQINGGLGLAFPDLTETQVDRLEAIATYLWQVGVDAFLPTLVTTSVDNVHRALSTLAHYQPSGKQPTATVLGAHLEGPFLNPQKRGAHPEEYLQPLTVEQIKTLLGSYAPWVKMMTLAPELDPSGAAIAYLRANQILVSLGHSLATAQEAQTAFEQGATMVTHAFNAMPPLHHREPGLLGAAVFAPGVWCGFIADGQHIDPLMLKWLLRASAPERLCLVSDALAPLGLPDGIYPWDSRSIEVKQGTARLPDGTLSGTTLPLLDGVRNLVKWDICSVEMAIALATETPRAALALPGLGVGQSARQLLRWHLAPERTLTWQRLWSPQQSLWSQPVAVSIAEPM